MTNDLDDLRRRVQELEQDRKSFFKTGIIVLGATVAGLIGYIWVAQIGRY